MVNKRSYLIERSRSGGRWPSRGPVRGLAGTCRDPTRELIRPDKHRVRDRQSYSPGSTQVNRHEALVLRFQGLSSVTFEGCLHTVSVGPSGRGDRVAHTCHVSARCGRGPRRSGSRQPREEIMEIVHVTEVDELTPEDQRFCEATKAWFKIDFVPKMSRVLLTIPRGSVGFGGYPARELSPGRDRPLRVSPSRATTLARLMKMLDPAAVGAEELRPSRAAASARQRGRGRDPARRARPEDGRREVARTFNG